MNTLTINIDLATTPVDAVAEVLRILNGSAPAAEVKKPSKKAEKAEEKTTEPVKQETVPAPNAEASSAVTVEQLRAVATEKRKAGKAPAEIKTVLAKYGTDSISAMAPEHYAAAFEDLINL